MPVESPLPTAPPVQPYDVEVFYDGACPLCRREIALLRRWDKRNRIRFTDIAAAGFDPAIYGTSQGRLMAEIHGRDARGNWIVGVEVFRKLYAAVGFGPLVAVTRWPLIRHALDAAYRLFAPYRLRLTGRCREGECAAEKGGLGRPAT